ncbi:MAG: hypothetical protein HYW50_01970 [Candidatus Diapherotrites archaeon]|nr:hypothetical protein [Candidatus Diapherotrites archaeon]
MNPLLLSWQQFAGVAVVLLLALFVGKTFFGQENANLSEPNLSISSIGSAISIQQTVERKNNSGEFSCVLTAVYWGKDTVFEGETVSITLEAKNCDENETVELELWESDGTAGSERVAEVIFENVLLENNMSRVEWKSVWVRDFGDPFEWTVQNSGSYLSQFDPEYFLKARLGKNPSKEIFSEKNLIVKNRVENLILD